MSKYALKNNQNSFGRVKYGRAINCRFESTLTKLTVHDIPVAFNKIGMPIKTGTVTVGVKHKHDFDFDALLRIACASVHTNIIA